MLTLVLAALAAVLATISIVQSRGAALLPWAVLALALIQLLSRLTHLS